MKFDIDLSGFTPKSDYILTYTQAKCLRQYVRNAIDGLGGIAQNRSIFLPSDIVLIKADMQSASEILAGLDKI